MAVVLSRRKVINLLLHPPPPYHRHCRLSFISSSSNGNNSSSSSSSSRDGEEQGSETGNTYLVPGATVATIFMLGILHARRLYNDKKHEEAREKGIDIEFSPDAKAAFLRLLPLRSISRMWGFVTDVKFPIWLRPYIHKAWARAFHSNLEEAALPLDQYASLRDFFTRTLKAGSRPIDPDPHCMVSPVDGTVLRFGELKESGAMIEQVKGFSYSAYSLLGASSILTSVPDIFETDDEYKKSAQNRSKRSWWRVSLASPQVREPTPTGQMKGRLMPLNERATRTIKNLYVENERVVLEGQWSEGFFALAAIGATNIGSIELSIEPELRTNKWKKLLTLSEPPQERVYEPEGVGVMLKKGEEVATFNMGSTVVLVFQAPISKSKQEDIEGNGNLSEFNFSVKRGDRVRMGEALGRWSRD